MVQRMKRQRSGILACRGYVVIARRASRSAPGVSDRHPKGRDRETPENSHFPPFPQGGVAVLADVIEASADEVRAIIAYLLAHIQVQVSRIRNLKFGDTAGTRQRIITVPDIKVYIWDAVEIYARCELLFGYARRESTTVQADPTSEDMSRGLFVMGFRGDVLDGGGLLVCKGSRSGRQGRLDEIEILNDARDVDALGKQGPVRDLVADAVVLHGRREAVRDSSPFEHERRAVVEAEAR